MKYSWVDIPANTTRPRLARGTKRVFHRHQAGCIRKGIRVDVHYLNRDPALADAAIAKLEKGTKKSN
jgi:hypothetical protein